MLCIFNLFKIKLQSEGYNLHSYRSVGSGEAMFEINEVLTIPSVSNGAQHQFRLFLFLQNIQCGVVIVCTSNSDFEIRPPEARRSTARGFFKWKWKLLIEVKIEVDFHNNFSYNYFVLKYKVLCKFKKNRSHHSFGASFGSTIRKQQTCRQRQTFF